MMVRQSVTNPAREPVYRVIAVRPHHRRPDVVAIHLRSGPVAAFVLVVGQTQSNMRTDEAVQLVRMEVRWELGALRVACINGEWDH